MVVPFGPYRLSGRVATGGMAEVYAARKVSEDGAAGPMVALKRLLPHLARDPSVVRMFLNEARITAQIDHPNVVKVLELGQHNGEPYIAMELLVGRSFAELRQAAADLAERVPIGITLRVLTEACRGLDAAHRVQDEHGKPLAIVHRDFTPDNIHVGADGRVKVIDFGIARAENLGSGTEPGTLKGKFFYMSPEMIAGRPVDHRADLYAAAVMLYEQLCGRRPFTGNTPEEVLERISQARPKRPGEFDPSVPPALEAVCLQALRQHPEDRFSSLEEFIHAIESVRGAAELASDAELRTYFGRLFPLELDATAVAVAHAREIDPSVPRGDGTDAIPPAARTPKPRAPKVADELRSRVGSSLSGQELNGAGRSSRTTDDLHSGARWSSPADELDAGARSSSPADELDSAAPSPPARGGGVAPRQAPRASDPSVAATTRLPSRTMFALALGAMLAVGAAAGWFAFGEVGRNAVPAAERLSLAERTQEPGARAKMLGGLAKDDTATEAQLTYAGELLLQSGAHDAALELATDWVHRGATSAPAKLLEARACIGLRQGRRAEAAIEAARTLDSASAEPELALADLKELQGDLSGASAALQSALQKDPSSVKIARRNGVLLSQSGRLDEAEAALGALLRRRFDAETAAELAFVKYRKDRPQDALGLLRRALKEQPKLAAGHYYLGAVLYRSGDAKGSERAYREALLLAPRDSRPLISLCELYTQSGRRSELPSLHQEIDARFAERAAALKRQCGE